MVILDQYLDNVYSINEGLKKRERKSIKMNINQHSKNSHNNNNHNNIDIENSINIYNKDKINNNVKKLVVTSL